MRLKRETEVAIAILVACARSNDCRLKTADAGTDPNKGIWRVARGS